jgi:hypothetical protein
MLVEKGRKALAVLRLQQVRHFMDDDVLDDENDSHKIRHKFFKRLRHIELATNTSSSEKFGSIHFAKLFEILAT